MSLPGIAARRPRARLAALALLALSSAASAQVLYVRAGATPGLDGRSWATAFPDLQTALALASSGDEIWVAAGRYVPSAFLDRNATYLLPDGVSLLGGFAGTETDPSQRDVVANVTILDGDLRGDDGPAFANYSDNSRHVVTALGNATVEVDGLSVRGGSEGHGAGMSLVAEDVHLSRLTLRENFGLLGTNEGGGVFVQAATVRLEDCAFRDNKATGGAGMALRCSQPSGEAELERCTFERNRSTGGSGLSVSAGASSLAVGLRDCTFRDQLATGGAGVAFESEVPSQLVVEGCLFERLEVTSGGGLSMTSEQGCDVEVSDSVFRDCTATAGAGLFVHCEQTSHVVASNCLFERTRACAGAIYLYGASAVVARCRVLAEPAVCGLGAGGDAVRVDLPTDQAEIRDSLFVGGARPLVWSKGTLRVDGCTLATTGGTSSALHSEGGTATVENSILWGAPTQQLTFRPSTHLLVEHSDVYMAGVALPGTANLDVDPLFVNAAAGDYGLRATSPCVDAGDPALVRAGADIGSDSRLLDGDLNGRVRIDMGADEYGPVRLRVVGTPAVGNTLNFLTTGAPGLTTRMMFGGPGLRHVPGLGTLFTSPVGLQVFGWPGTPSNVAAVVPPTVFGLTLHVQALCFGGGAAVVSNYVVLQF